MDILLFLNNKHREKICFVCRHFNEVYLRYFERYSFVEVDKFSTSFETNDYISAIVCAGNPYYGGSQYTVPEFFHEHESDTCYFQFQFEETDTSLVQFLAKKKMILPIPHVSLSGTHSKMPIFAHDYLVNGCAKLWKRVKGLSLSVDPKYVFQRPEGLNKAFLELDSALGQLFLPENYSLCIFESSRIIPYGLVKTSCSQALQESILLLIKTSRSHKINIWLDTAKNEKASFDTFIKDI